VEWKITKSAVVGGPLEQRLCGGYISRYLLLRLAAPHGLPDHWRLKPILICGAAVATTAAFAF
jgi:hypothetical protein